jgi:hypothetical protein
MATFVVTWTQEVAVTQSFEAEVDALDLPEAYKKIEEDKFKKKLLVGQKINELKMNDDLVVTKSQPLLLA